MNKKENNGSEKIAFKIISSNEKSAVFKRVVMPKGRKEKEVNKIELSFPTATVCFFNASDFEKLKKIEVKVHEEIERNRSGKSVVNYISDWLELK